MLYSFTCSAPPLAYPPQTHQAPPPHTHNHCHNKSKHITCPPELKNLKPSVARGNRLHHANSWVRSNLVLHNFYLQLYMNEGALAEAQELFDKMPERTLISWTILMSGYAKRGLMYETLVVFLDLLCDTGGRLIRPDPYVYSVVLRACTAEEDLRLGRGVHGHILKTGVLIDDFVENALLNMYGNAGLLRDAFAVFSNVESPDPVAWTSMIGGHIRGGFNEAGIKIFLNMICKDVKPDAFAFSMVTKACSNLGCEEFGKQVHGYSIKIGYSSNLFLDNSLMDFYAKCGNMERMRQIFDQMAEKDLVSWNTLIIGYAINLQYHEALGVFRVLINEVSLCDCFSLGGILKAIAGLGDLRYGREVHAYIIRAGFDSNDYAVSSLMDMYIECIEHQDMETPKDIPLKLFSLLGEESAQYNIPSLLKWCSLQSDIRTGEVMHSLVIKHNLHGDPFSICALIDMYSKCGLLEASQKVFLGVEDPMTAPWSALIAGYVWNGLFREALVLFRKMQFIGVKSNEYTFTSTILACLALSDVRKVKELHGKVLRAGYESNISVVNALIRVYSQRSCIMTKLSTSFPLA